MYHYSLAKSNVKKDNVKGRQLLVLFQDMYEHN